MKIYNYNAIMALINKNYHFRHIAIIIGCSETTARTVSKSQKFIEPTTKFLTQEQKQRWLVLDKLLQLKPTSPKWCSNDYYYITILKFLLVPREVVCNIYKHAPTANVAQAYKEKSPFFKKFSYKHLDINSEEYNNFVQSCYNIINDPTKWR